LTGTILRGTVIGPLATLGLTQTFAAPVPPGGSPVEVLYRFPLPGDAAVMVVRVRFATVEVRTELKERSGAEAEYAEAKATGRQAALVTRESPDVFTLAVTGVLPGETVTVDTDYLQVAKADGAGWSLRIPLTVAPRYTRPNEDGDRHAAGQPLALAVDPGHRFELDLTVRGATGVTSPTHGLAVDGERVRLSAGIVVPDRDCVVRWSPAGGPREPLTVWVNPDPASGCAYLLAVATPPPRPAGGAWPREVILLVDHSGSMAGAKWAAADWAVERFLSGLTPADTFALGVFHNRTRWFAEEPCPASPETIQAAVQFLKGARDDGGTELGAAIDQALGLPRSPDDRGRHLLIVTDAQVTDAGRILARIDQEAAGPDRRRVSVLCIDAVANVELADEIADRGAGVSRYLTSDSKAGDIATALDDVLADWAAPACLGLTLVVNRPSAEAVNRTTFNRIPDPGVGIDLGDPPAGRPTWVAARVPLAGPPLSVHLTDREGRPTAETIPVAGEVPGLRAIFGANRIRRLEYLMHAGLSSKDLSASLGRVGYDIEDTEQNKIEVRPLLVRESLAFGLPSSEAAFVAVRTEAGQRVGETLVVPNAIPDGWKELGAGARGIDSGLFAPLGMAAPVRKMAMRRLMDPLIYMGPESVDLCLMDFSVPADPVGIGTGSTTNSLVISVLAGRHAVGDGAVLYDSVRDAAIISVPASGTLTALTILPSDPPMTADRVGDDLTLLLFVGTAVDPRAKIRLADVLRQGGTRPLNVCWMPGESIRLVVADPAGRWAAGVPAMTLTFLLGS
jgi:Ca-activated chloride channel family protein